MSSDEIKLILQRLGNIETGVMNLGTRLESLENKVEERLQDTRPMWQAVQSQLKELREGQERLQEGQKNINSELRALRKAFSRTYSDLLITQEEQEERLEKLEGKQQ
ncbi:MAG: hypothetical protein AB1631_02230 [Acidobacteriota bacterium]